MRQAEVAFVYAHAFSSSLWRRTDVKEDTKELRTDKETWENGRTWYRGERKPRKQRNEESERGERARTSVHVVARGEAWFVGGPCSPDRCNPLGTRCSAKPYSFLSAVRHPTLLSASLSPRVHPCLRRCRACSRHRHRLLPCAHALCIFKILRSVMPSVGTRIAREKNIWNLKFEVKDPWGSYLYFWNNLRD